jgi:hypothetical protein
MARRPQPMQRTTYAARTERRNEQARVAVRHQGDGLVSRALLAGFVSCCPGDQAEPDRQRRHHDDDHYSGRGSSHGGIRYPRWPV